MDATPEMSPTSYVVLGLLVSRGPSTPYELKRTLASSLGHLWSFPHSRLYAEPERLTSVGLVEEHREMGGRRRRTFSVTPAGRQEFMRWLGSTDSGSHELRDPGLLKLFFADLADSDQTVELAREQESRHRDRAEAYEEMAQASDDAEEMPLRAATMRMGLIFEQASVRFWRSVAERAASRSPEDTDGR